MIIKISRRKTMVHTVCFGQLTGIVFFFIVFPQHQLNCRRISLTSIVLQDSIMFMAASHFSLKTHRHWGLSVLTSTRLSPHPGCKSVLLFLFFHYLYHVQTPFFKMFGTVCKCLHAPGTLTTTTIKAQT